MIKRTCCFFFLLSIIAFSGCYPQRTFSSSIESTKKSETPVNISTATPIPSTTNTPEIITTLDNTTQFLPTIGVQQVKNTPPPSSTPTAIPTPTPLPTKQILIKFEIIGGDGGSPTLDYRGRNTPNFVLYTDGQLLTREGNISLDDNENGYVFKQTILTSTEVCSILNSIRDTGFFEIEGNRYQRYDSFYNFDDSVDFIEGGPSYLIQVNDINPKSVLVFYQYSDYVVTEIKEVYDLLNSYKISDASPFLPKQVVLWIEKRNSNFVEATQNWPSNFQSWPSNLTPLSELITSVNFSEYKGVVVEENLDTLLQLFDYKMKLAFFEENGEEYVVIPRPLLPHETPNNFLWGSEQESAFPLPYKCDE